MISFCDFFLKLDLLDTLGALDNLETLDHLACTENHKMHGGARNDGCATLGKTGSVAWKGSNLLTI